MAVACVPKRRRSLPAVEEAFNAQRFVGIITDAFLQPVKQIERVSDEELQCFIEGGTISINEEGLASGEMRVVVDEDLPKFAVGQVLAVKPGKNAEIYAKVVGQKEGVFTCERLARQGRFYGGRFIMTQLELDLKLVTARIEENLFGAVWLCDTTVFEQLCNGCGDTVVKVVDVATRSETFVHLQTLIGRSIWSETSDGKVKMLTEEAINAGSIVIDLASKFECAGVKFSCEVGHFYPNCDEYTHKVIYHRD